MTVPDAFLLTCEHGGNRVPARYHPLFRGARDVLESHRGYDIGAATIARHVARGLHTSARMATVTRLLVDLNRSPRHPGRFSEYVRSIDDASREIIATRYYRPYRDAVGGDVARLLARRRLVLHLSVHSFTPVMNGMRRDVDIGLLYDPARRGERDWCIRWAQLLAALRPDLRIRRNTPYRGTLDGLTRSLRSRHAPGRYLGIEIEVNQALARREPVAVAHLIVSSLTALGLRRPPPGRAARKQRP